ncbi:MAG: 7,8-didemethyl-8-hydroxy-5-deazariboflavin synthase CofG [Deltaproteobacteria bacterium]|nr:7,8-didemethyl-8-hydroxy-5-deazariboflavin synthase CofG [Deltaproteobacteria bacterium]
MQAAGTVAWAAPDPRLTSDVLAAALERAAAGEQVTQTEAEVLINLDDQRLPELFAGARRLRERYKGSTVTYSPKVFLPVTNLCRDFCGYCTFRKDPNDPEAWTMMPDEIRTWSRDGRARGCREALLCLGDKPELVFKSYRTTLAALGHRTTIEYVRRACEIALAEGLLPHTNAGLMTRAEMASLKPVNASMGLMLESMSPRLCQKGGPHHHAPDKDPALRLQMIHEAGELQIPFTTGILVGIGETRAECVTSLLAIRAAHQRCGHIQEVIVQNFRAKPSSAMAVSPEPDTLELARTIAVCRLLMPAMNIQAPPNLSPYDHRLILNAGINDWGGISPLTRDYVNPEAPWPHVAALADTCRGAGAKLTPRLPIYDEFIDRPGFLDPELRARVRAFTAEGVLPC